MATPITPDIYQQVTDQIVTAMEAGAGKWEMPWHRSGTANGRPVNVLERGSAYGFDLSGINPGGQLFVSAATAGDMADTAPVTSTQFVVPVGEVRTIDEGGTAVKVLRVAINQAHVAYVAL